MTKPLVGGRYGSNYSILFYPVNFEETNNLIYNITGSLTLHPEPEPEPESEPEPEPEPQPEPEPEPEPEAPEPEPEPEPEPQPEPEAPFLIDILNNSFEEGYTGTDFDVITPTYWSKVGQGDVIISHKNSSLLNYPYTIGNYVCVLVNKINNENTGIKQTINHLEVGKQYHFKFTSACLNTSIDHNLLIKIHEDEYNYTISNNLALEKNTIFFIATKEMVDMESLIHHLLMTKHLIL